MYKGLNNDLVYASDMFAKAQTVPQTAGADGNGGSLEVSNTQNSVNVVVRANTTTTVIAAETLVITLEDSADDSTFAALSTVVSVTGGVGNTVYAVNDIIAEVVLPANARRYVKAVITSEGLNTGKLDIYPVIVPR